VVLIQLLNYFHLIFYELEEYYDSKEEDEGKNEKIKE
jgi:hypothetical protein